MEERVEFMFSEYNRLFERFLEASKSKFDRENPYENLSECIKPCNQCTWELAGMLTLMQAVGEISIEIKDKGFQRILDTFSTTELFDVFTQNGEVKVLCK